MDNEIDSGIKAHDLPSQDQSDNKKSSVRIWVTIIAIYLIAYSAIVDYIVANHFGMILSPSFPLEFLLTVCGIPIFVPLIPSVLDLLRLNRRGINMSIAFLVIFGIIPGIIVVISGPGGDVISFILSLISTLVIPCGIIYWMVENRKWFKL